ncbi:MAG: helix-turn-helix domain-containing protein [Dehalococcoidia bacterium]|nr:MAG: helix-turn-helix domain-containing protein [Dehalococcoidia bacterium]
MSFLRRGDDARRDEAARDLATSRRAEATRLGEVFRNERTRRGVSLQDAERTTRINRVYLEAIEEGRLEAMPAPVYVRGFVRLYARFLGLDPVAAVEAIPEGLPRPAGLEPMPGMRRNAPSTIPMPSLPPLTPPVLAAAVGGFILLIALVWLVPKALGGDDSKAPAANATPKSSAPAARTGEVPNLVGLARDVATKAVTDAGFAPLVFEATNAAPPGQVFQQSPAPGTALAPGTAVTLFVSQPPLPASATPTRTPSPTATPAR